MEESHKYGKISGAIKSYAMDGKLISVGHYALSRPSDKSEWISLKHGDWIFYDDKGNVIRKETYKSGVKQQ